MRRRSASTLVALAVVLAACADADEPATSPPEIEVPPSVPTTSTGPSREPPTTTAPTAPPTTPTIPRPDWLGRRELPLRPDGLGEVQPTPAELVDRRFATIDVLPAPTTEDFVPTVSVVPGDVAARSTWGPGCPVALTDLRYVTVPFHGFDGLRHTGELLVHADAVEAVVAGFEHLHAVGFPIEEMRITRADELDAHPTGDGNNTGAFVCRSRVGSTTWSNHAYGRAVDINPFHNPYVRGEVVIPELASAYVDRSTTRPGMLTSDDLAGFTSAGWSWGASFGDPMHVSADGG